MDMTAIVQTTKEKQKNQTSSELNFLCIKRYYQVNEKTTHKMRGKKLANHKFDKGLISRIYKKSQNSVRVNKQLNLKLGQRT